MRILLTLIVFIPMMFVPVSFAQNYTESINEITVRIDEVNESISKLDLETKNLNSISSEIANKVQNLDDDHEEMKKEIEKSISEHSEILIELENDDCCIGGDLCCISVGIKSDDIDEFIKNEDRKFLESLTFIITPILIGGYLTNRLSNSWHNYQLKIKLKKEVLDLSHESIVTSINLQDSFMREISDAYTAVEDFSELEETGYVNKEMIFPKEPHEFPENKFKIQFDNLQKKFVELRAKRMKLETKLKLYFNDESLIEDLKIISKRNGVISSKLKKIMKAQTKEEWEDIITSFYDYLDENLRLIDAFEQKLIGLKIKKIAV